MLDHLQFMGRLHFWGHANHPLIYCHPAALALTLYLDLCVWEWAFACCETETNQANHATDPDLPGSKQFLAEP